MVYKWAQPAANEGGIGNPLDRIEALYQSTGDSRLIQWICQRAGGFFILNPKNVPHPHFLIPATNQIVQEFADLLQVVAAIAAAETNKNHCRRGGGNPQTLGGIEKCDGRIRSQLRKR